MSVTTQTITVRVPDVPDWVCDLIAEVARATGTDHGTATRLALVEGLLAIGARRQGAGDRRQQDGHLDEGPSEQEGGRS